MFVETIRNLISPEDTAAAGAAIYTKPVLMIYDLLVMGFENHFVWKCPSRLLVDFYDEHISQNHLEVGVGTGYLLDKCQFSSQDPTLALLDINPNSLETTSRRICRYSPATHQANVLDPISIDLPTFDSMGLNYLFHCLPGTLSSKGIVFDNLMPFLNDGGVMFGSTILGQGVEFGLLGRMFMGLYNSIFVLSNRDDDLVDLKNVLEEKFGRYSVHVEGSVAFFVGYV